MVKLKNLLTGTPAVSKDDADMEEEDEEDEVVVEEEREVDAEEEEKKKQAEVKAKELAIRKKLLAQMLKSRKGKMKTQF